MRTIKIKKYKEMSLITKAKKFDASQVTYRAPTTNKRGGKAVQVQLNGHVIRSKAPIPGENKEKIQPRR